MAGTSIENIDEGFKNIGKGKIKIEHISKQMKPEVWERIKKEILESFRRPEWREIVRLTLENPRVLDWARDFDEYKYYLRGVIARYIEKGINREFYEKLYRMLMDQKALEYLEQTILVKLVEWGIISRPDTRSEGAIYYLYEWYNIEKLMEIDVSRFRGIIYDEKKSAAEEIAGELYAVGFLTAYGKGYPTWKMRLAAQQGKLHVYCDADWAGGHIYKVFAEGAERLKRISRGVARAKRKIKEELTKRGYSEDELFLLEDASKEWIKLVVKNSKRLGLDFNDAEKLGLPWEPEPKCSNGEECRRYELQSLVDLRMRYGIECPHLAYTVYRLKNVFKEELKPLLPDPLNAYTTAVVDAISTGIYEFVRNRVGKLLEGVEEPYEGLRLKRDLAENLAERIAKEVAEKILKKEVKPRLTDTMIRLDLGLPVYANDPDDFEEKFYEWAGASKVEKLLS